jgi:hypothetical protein
VAANDNPGQNEIEFEQLSRLEELESLLEDLEEEDAVADEAGARLAALGIQGREHLEQLIREGHAALDQDERAD